MKIQESLSAMYNGEVAYSHSPNLQWGWRLACLIRQEIYEDDYGFDAWDTSVRSRCFVHVLISAQYFAVRGVRPLDIPPTAAKYTDAGLPWLEYDVGDTEALEGSAELAWLDSVAAQKSKTGEAGLPAQRPGAAETHPACE